MSFNASTDEWYQYFKRDDGPQALILLSFYGGRALFATLGMLFNASIVYVTVMSKSLRGVINIMLAVESASALVMDATFWFSFMIQLSGLRFVRYDQCFWFIEFASLGGNCAQVTMVFTGLDRLFAVLFPIWYKGRSKKFHFVIYGTVITLWLIYDYILNYIDFDQTRDVMLACSSNEIGLTETVGLIQHVQTITLSGLITIIYGSVWVIVFLFKVNEITVSENNRRLIKSLLIIIFIHIFGVIFRSIVNLLFTVTSPNVFVRRGFSNAASFLTITVYSANAPVLYIISTEYRTNLNLHFKWLKKALGLFDPRTHFYVVVCIYIIGGPYNYIQPFLNMILTLERIFVIRFPLIFMRYRRRYVWGSAVLTLIPPLVNTSPYFQYIPQTYLKLFYGGLDLLCTAFFLYSLNKEMGKRIKNRLVKFTAFCELFLEVLPAFIVQIANTWNIIPTQLKLFVGLFSTLFATLNLLLCLLYYNWIFLLVAPRLQQGTINSSEHLKTIIVRSAVVGVTNPIITKQH